MKNKVLTAPFDLSPFLCKYIETLDFKKNLSPHSIRAYSSDLLQVFQIKGSGKVIGPKLDGSPLYSWLDIKPLKPQEMDFWKKQVTQAMSHWGNLSVKSRRRKLSSLSSFLAWLKSDQNIDFEMIIPTTKPPNQTIPNFLSVDECLSVIDYLEKKPIDKKKFQQRLLFYLLYGCGLRLSEACELRTDKVSLDKKQLRIMGKGSKERIAVLPGKVISTLKESLKNKTQYVFGDTPLPTRSAYEAIRQLGKACGLLKPLHPHALRHSYATQLLSSGSDLRVLQQLLGHQSLAATEIYTHLDVDQLARSMEEYHPLSQAKKGIKK